MDYNITLTANHQSLTAKYLPLAAESVQYLTAKVVYETDDWTGREIKAMFGRGSTVYEVPVTGGEITAKQQLNLTAGDWRVWLVGNSARDGEVIPRITTNVAHIRVAPTGGTEGSPFPATPPTVEEQLRADMGNLADLTTEDKSSLVAAINEVRQTGGGPEGPNEISTDTATALNGLLKGNGSTVQVAERGVDYVQPDDIMQSDWNQNDSTQPDYVKNRPFYTGDPVETILVEESTVSFSLSESEGVYMGGLKSTFSATVGETYKVSWDGTVYECTSADFSGRATIGNLSIAGAGSDTGEPFLMVVNNGREIAIGTADTSASHTFSISGFVTEAVKIDPKYLPDTIATKSEVEVARTTANNARATAENARSTANTAKTAAENARSTANTAKTAAENAQTTAENARSTANTAKTTAENARSTANTAKTTAENAQSTANTAKTTAENAQSTANAAKTEVAKALTVDSSGSINAPIGAMNDGAYQSLKLSSKDQYHSASFKVTESVGLQIYVDRDCGMQSSASNSSTVEFIANGAPRMRLKGIDELIMNSSTAGSTKKFRITVDDSGTLTATEVS